MMSSLSARLASPWWSRVLVALRSLRSLPSLLLAVVLSLSLVACGPGVGGSGTGDAAVADPLPALGATPQGLCAGELAPLLDCSATAIGAASPTPGTGVVYFIDTIDGRRVLVRLEGNTIELDVPCARLRFSGTWASIGGQAARFYGLTGPDTALVPAVVPAVVDARMAGSSLQLTLRDAAGVVLLGPVLVTRSPAAGTPGGCG